MSEPETSEGTPERPPVSVDGVDPMAADARFAPHPTAPASLRASIALGAAWTVVAAAFYLPGAGRSFDFDSAQTVGNFVLTPSPFDAFRLQQVFNNHPFFSFLEHLVVSATGSSDEAVLRLLPIAFGALSVGLVAAACARRWGAIAACGAAMTLATNPLMVAQARSVRGYTLLTFCAVASTLLLLELRRTDRPREALAVSYVVVAGIGLATHLYMVPILVGQVAVIGREALRPPWRSRLVAIGLMGLLAYAGMAEVMAESSRSHGRVFQADLPIRVAGALLGAGAGRWLLAPVVLAGAFLAWRSPTARRAATGVGATLAFLWLIQASSSLTERFFIWLVPAAAVLVALCISRWRWSVLAVVAAAACTVAAQLPDYLDEPTGYREAGALIHAVRSAGDTACVANIGVRPMSAYAEPETDFVPVTEPGQLADCDVLVVAADWDSTEPWFEPDLRIVETAEDRYAHRTTFDGMDPTTVFADQPLSYWMDPAAS